MFHGLVGVTETVYLNLNWYENKSFNPSLWLVGERLWMVSCPGG